MARAAEYLPKAIEKALGDGIPVDVVRQTDETRRELDRLKRNTSVIWRMRAGYEPEGPFEFAQVLDGSALLARFFEIEFRSDSCLGAQGMAEAVIAELGTVGAHIFTQYDEADDFSQKQSRREPGGGGYFAHIVEIGLPAIGLPDLESTDPMPAM